MKKHLYSVLAMSLIVASLTACGKDTPEESIKKIEASNAAESKESTERKYEDTNKEPVVAPDRNSGSTSTEENTSENDTNTVENVEPSIYGVWVSADGSNLVIFNSSDGIKFNMFDASVEEYLTGDVTTDNTSYIEIKYLKPVSNEVVNEENTEPLRDENGEIVLDENGNPVYPEQSNPYSSDEELYAALEKEKEEMYETVRYNIDKNEFNQEYSIMTLVLTGSGKTLEFTSEITSSTPDYSLEDNELAQDVINNDSYSEEAGEEVTE